MFRSCFFCKELLVRDTNLHYKDCSEMHTMKSNLVVVATDVIMQIVLSNRQVQSMLMHGTDVGTHYAKLARTSQKVV